jgi:hypothetical protein
MKKYNLNIKIEAATSKEAELMIKSLSTLASKLPTEVLVQLADVISNPVKLAFAKSQLGIK